MLKEYIEPQKQLQFSGCETEIELILARSACFQTPENVPRKFGYRVFSLTWPASVQIYWNKRKRLHKEKSSTAKGLVWDTNMAAVLLFWDTNMAAVTSCENTLLDGEGLSGYAVFQANSLDTVKNPGKMPSGVVAWFSRSSYWKPLVNSFQLVQLNIILLLL